jgi:hypothetical protein
MTRASRSSSPVKIIVEQTARSGRIFGPVRIIHPAIKQVGCPWQYDHRRHAHLVPVQYLDDVLVAIELLKIKPQAVVEYRGPGW